MANDLQQRIEAVERITALFRTERLVYLVATSIACVMVLASAIRILLHGQAGYGELSLLFGSSGFIAYQLGRLLLMWTEAIKRLIPIDEPTEKAK